MKQLLASIFLIIFSFQVLPVKELGKLLFKNTMTEEVHESDCDADDAPIKLKKDSDFFKLSEIEISAQTIYLNKKISTALHKSEWLPKHHVPDIFAPPPNCA